MFVSRATNYAVRLSLSQSQEVIRKSDPTTWSACLLAGIGLAVSSLGLKQLLSTATSRSKPRL